jgi:hypothetical protein
MYEDYTGSEAEGRNPKDYKWNGITAQWEMKEAKMKLLVPYEKLEKAKETLAKIVQRLHQTDLLLTLNEFEFIKDIVIEVESIDIPSKTIITGIWEPAKTAKSHCRKCRKSIPRDDPRLNAKYLDSVLGVTYHVFFCGPCGKEMTSKREAFVSGARRSMQLGQLKTKLDE